MYIVTAQKCLDADDIPNCEKVLERFRVMIVSALRIDDRLLR